VKSKEGAASALTSAGCSLPKLKSKVYPVGYSGSGLATAMGAGSLSTDVAYGGGVSLGFIWPRALSNS
jgi:hypothetical protein